MVTNSIPNIKVTLGRRPGFNVWITENCPYCGRRHTHNASNDSNKLDESLGVRTSHCNGGQYILVRN